MPDSRVGANLGSVYERCNDCLAALGELGYGWVRRSVLWGWDQQTPGHYTVDPAVDTMVTDWTDQGITFVMLLFDDEPRVDQSNFADPAAIRKFGEYVRFIVRHFEDRVRYFELWNEPNGGKPPNIALADYLAMVRHVVPIIRQEAPAAKIVIPAVSGQGVPGTSEFGTGWRNAFDRDYLFGILASDVMPLVDAISWHPLYNNQADETYYQTYPDLVGEIRARAEEHGFRGEYIAEEMGWAIAGNPTTEGQLLTTAAKSMVYQLRTIVTHRALDVIPIIGPPGREESRPIARTNALLAGARATTIGVQITTAAAHLRQYGFNLPDGSRLVALWTDWLPVENDPGVAATVTIDGLGGSRAWAVDVMAGTSQQLITSASDGRLLIEDLLVKDYPIFLRIGS